MLDFERLQFNTTEPVYLQIAQFVKQQIFMGTAAQGEALPSRRELAALLRVNPNTVQKAFRLMQEGGYLVTPPNAVSTLAWDEAAFSAIRKEMTAGLVEDFVRHAKANGLTLDLVQELLQEKWGDEK